MVRFVSLCVMGALLSGCVTHTATQYQPLKENEGYQDRQIRPGTYEIEVRGNNITTHETLVAHFHRRAQELCPMGYACDVSSRITTHITDGHLIRGPVYIPRQVYNSPYVTGEITCKKTSKP